jgi:hypothetical protein
MTSQSSSKRRPAGASADTTSEVTEQVKEAAGQVASQAQQTASQVAGQAREQAAARLTGQKDRAADGLTNVAQALRQTGQQLRDQDQQAFTGYIESAASQVERVSNYLRQRDLGQLIDDVEYFARRQPALFLGGTFVAGLLGARFLKSSRPPTGPGRGMYQNARGVYDNSRGAFDNTYMAQRERRFYTGYPSEADIRAASAVPNYGPGTKSGPYTSSGETVGGQPASYGTTTRSHDRGSEE